MAAEGAGWTHINSNRFSDCLAMPDQLSSLPSSIRFSYKNDVNPNLQIRTYILRGSDVQLCCYTYGHLIVELLVEAPDTTSLFAPVRLVS